MIPATKFRFDTEQKNNLKDISKRISILTQGVVCICSQILRIEQRKQEKSDEA